MDSEDMLREKFGESNDSLVSIGDNLRSNVHD